MKFQDYQVALSIGYVYLVFLGILNQGFYYGQLGVDYLSYSSITDVLISPIAIISLKLSTFVFFFLLLLIVVIAPLVLPKHKDKPWFKSAFKFEDGVVEEGQIQQNLHGFFVFMFALFSAGFFVGTGIGAGFNISKEIKKNEIAYEDELNYINEKTQAVKIVGKNSAFLFYIPEGKTQVEIAPINNGLITSFADKKRK